MKRNTIENVLRRLMPIPESGCMVWEGCTDERGYGLVTFHRKGWRVHRLVWEHFNGPIPEGLELDHLCRVHPCSNVHHLEPTTSQVNILRGVGPAAICARKTECLRGHAFDELNTYIDSLGRRICRACRSANVGKWKKNRGTNDQGR